MRAWRIEKATYIDQARTGEGARLVGGRWSSPGRAVIYCAEHLSLAILEVLAHSPDPSQRRAARVMYEIHMAPRLVEEVASSLIPENYSPRTPVALTRAIGDEWLVSGRTPVLSVPSAIVPTERNYLLNPTHRHFARLQWNQARPISLDDRLWAVG